MDYYYYPLVRRTLGPETALVHNRDHYSQVGALVSQDGIVTDEMVCYMWQWDSLYNSYIMKKKDMTLVNARQ